MKFLIFLICLLMVGCGSNNNSAKEIDVRPRVQVQGEGWHLHIQEMRVNWQKNRIYILSALTRDTETFNFQDSKFWITSPENPSCSPGLALIQIIRDAKKGALSTPSTDDTRNETYFVLQTLESWPPDLQDEFQKSEIIFAH